MLPIGLDGVTFRRRPGMTITIVALCTAVYFGDCAWSTVDVMGTGMREGALYGLVAEWADMLMTIDSTIEFPADCYISDEMKEDLDQFQIELLDSEQSVYDMILKDAMEGSLTGDCASVAEFLAIEDTDWENPFETYFDDGQLRVFNEFMSDWMSPIRARFALFPVDGPVQIGTISHIFVAKGLFALLWTMLFLMFMAGPALEELWGSALLAAFFVISGVLTGLIHMAVFAGSAQPYVGAGGAVSACVGAGRAPPGP